MTKPPSDEAYHLRHHTPARVVSVQLYTNVLTGAESWLNTLQFGEHKVVLMQPTPLLPGRWYVRSVADQPDQVRMSEGYETVVGAMGCAFAGQRAQP